MTPRLPAAAILLSLLPFGAMAERGAGGELRLLYWQAPTSLNPYLSSGPKDNEAASLILEPLARHDETGRLVPWLATHIPSHENGDISQDMTQVTWTLREGLLWSDGSPVTADDVVFTARYCMDKETTCQQAAKFADVTAVTALDAQRVQLEFATPKPYPFAPFVGLESPILQKAQFSNCIGSAAASCSEANLRPIGTGPYRVTDMRAGDVISFDMNPSFRDASKPGFATVTLKGGGDAVSAARAVLETGEFDYAWNLQVDPDILKTMQTGGKGTVISAMGTPVERLMINLTDPDAALGAARSTRDGGAHPILSDPRVTHALSMAIDRRVATELGYGPAGQPACDLIAAPAIYVGSDGLDCLTQDLDGARAMLDDAGWVDSDGDGIRDKDGRALSLLFQTSINPVRQTLQDLIKAWWAEIGVKTDLRAIEPSVFFGADQTSPDTFRKFFADVQMYTNFFPGTDPEAYLNNWRCDAAPTPDNGWAGANIPRYCDPDYDALTQKLAQTQEMEARAAIVGQLNEMLIEAGAIIPLVLRGRVSARANTLAGVKMNAWDSELWNIADWTRTR